MFGGNNNAIGFGSAATGISLLAPHVPVSPRFTLPRILSLR